MRHCPGIAVEAVIFLNKVGLVYSLIIFSSEDIEHTSAEDLQSATIAMYSLAEGLVPWLIILRTFRRTRVMKLCELRSMERPFNASRTSLARHHWSLYVVRSR